MESDPLDLYQPSTLCLKKEDTGEINMNMYFMYVAVLCSVAMPMALLALDRNCIALQRGPGYLAHL